MTKRKIQDPELAKKIHMVGIGGIGMSGLAFILSGMGSEVSGSDIEENNITDRLRNAGVRVDIKHAGSNIKDPDLVVFSSSIRPNNPELMAARKKGIRVIPRIELLRLVMKKFKNTVAVTGTHGKTTITAMISLLFKNAGLDPTVLIGGESPHFGGNAKLGKKRVLVAEVDESDGRFVTLKPTDVVIPNLEMEHVEHYRDEKHLVRSFRRFLSVPSSKQTLVYRIDDANLRTLVKGRRAGTVSFGFSRLADVYANDVKISPFRVAFDCFHRRKKLGRFTINIPGVHNVLNALAAISLGLNYGINVGVIRRSLASYKGVKRRFEIVGNINGARVVEDYAHHPTEIKATIQAAYSLKPKRLITVFQPHRYTRTRSFYKEFSSSFSGSDEVVLTEVYAASEKKVANATTERIYRAMVAEKNVPARLLKKERVPGYLYGKAKKGDLILILGAGDIGKTAREALSGVEK